MDKESAREMMRAAAALKEIKEFEEEETYEVLDKFVETLAKRAGFNHREIQDYINNPALSTDKEQIDKEWFPYKYIKFNTEID